jgi:hypothetical protein
VRLFAQSFAAAQYAAAAVAAFACLDQRAAAPRPELQKLLGRHSLSMSGASGRGEIVTVDAAPAARAET